MLDISFPSFRPESESGKPYISGITLGGFQVFDEIATIPLSKLTFLFGPNSAGKSSIEDGLAILLGVLNNNTKFGLVTNDLRRHWRRSEGVPVPTLTMGLSASFPVNILDLIDVPSCTGSHDSHSSDNEIWIGFRFAYQEEDGDIFPCARFDLSLNGTSLLEMGEGEFIGVNFQHPILAGYILSESYQTLAERIPTIVTCKDGWVRVRSPFTWFQSDDLSASTFWYGIEMRGNELPVGIPETIEKPLRRAAEELLAFFNEIKGIVLSNITVLADIVPASRTVPNPKELTFLFPGGDTFFDGDDYFPGSSSLYLGLATSCLAKRLTGTAFKWDSTLLDGVNRALSDHLFFERGYRICADFRKISDFEEPRSAEGQTTLPESACLVNVHLVDSQGRKQAFDQVGSGLGYVLPVLCSCADNLISISLVQQPELHLHPALQAAMGDVFIENADNTHQIIVETHSEHLLLRILKRIRQTSQGRAASPELSVSPSDVAVVYFNPKSNGVTEVKQLRISEDGDFLDRWPRGFFTERDGELFDE